MDPRFYHLDTALVVLDDEHRRPTTRQAFDEAGQRRRSRALFPDADRGQDADAEVLGLNAVSDGRNVVLPAQAEGLARELARRGFTVVPVDLSELRKAGGGPKCCTLELR